MFKKFYSHLISLFTTICVVLTSAITVSAKSPMLYPSVVSKETDVVPAGEEIEFKPAVITKNVYDLTGETEKYKVLIRDSHTLNEFVKESGIDDELYVKQYTQSFFDSHALVMIYQVCPGGGDSYSLKRILKTPDNKLALDVLFNTSEGMKTMIVTYQLGIYEVALSDVKDVTEMTDYTEPTLENNKFSFAPLDFQKEYACYYTANSDDTLTIYKQINSNYLREKYGDKITVIRDGKIINAKNDEGNYEYFILKSYDILQFKNDDGIICASYAVICPGDVDSDGKVSVSDAREALRASAKLGTYNHYELSAMNKNGGANPDISVYDARYLLRVAAKLETLPGKRIYVEENTSYTVEDFADGDGIRWMVSPSDSIHVKIEQEYIPWPDDYEIVPGNAPHSNFTFTPNQAGTYLITMTYRNPWEKGKIYEQFTFTLEVYSSTPQENI